jgi:hypothetical protein
MTGLQWDNGAAGAVTDTGDNSVFTSRNNTFTNNRYHLPDLTSSWFLWDGCCQDIDAWEGFGMDTGGTFDTATDNSTPPSPSRGLAPSSDAVASGNVTVPSTASYKVWTRIMAPDGSNDSVTLQIDNGPPVTVGDKALTPGTWTWVDYEMADEPSKISTDLTAGSHTIKLTAREDGVKLDRLLFLSDACVPSGNGDNCAPASPPPTPVYKDEDINQDGIVNILDFSLLASKFGQSGTGIGRTDINQDGIVNILDFSLLAAKFGT